MAINISISITPPAGMTDAEALRLFTDNNGYRTGQGETRAVFAKRIIADDIKADIRQQRKIEAEAAISIPDNVVVD